MNSCDWSNRIRYHIFDARPDTEVKLERGKVITKALSPGAQRAGRPVLLPLQLRPRPLRGRFSSNSHLNLSCFWSRIPPLEWAPHSMMMGTCPYYNGHLTPCNVGTSPFCNGHLTPCYRHLTPVMNT